MRKFNINVNGKKYEVEVEEAGAASTSTPAASAPAAPAAKPAAQAPAAPIAGAAQIKSPMPGTIVSIKVKKGDKVKADSVVAILEAMKMENEIFAGREGTVAEINANAGQTMNTGDLILSIK